jgi:hypothetical protein
MRVDKALNFEIAWEFSQCEREFLKSAINYLGTKMKFQNSGFQEDASPLSKQMKYALPKALSAAQSTVILNNETRKRSLGTRNCNYTSPI